jgi:hypothetical protein
VETGRSKRQRKPWKAGGLVALCLQALSCATKIPCPLVEPQSRGSDASLEETERRNLFSPCALRGYRAPDDSSSLSSIMWQQERGRDSSRVELSPECLVYIYHRILCQSVQAITIQDSYIGASSNSANQYLYFCLRVVLLAFAPNALFRGTCVRSTASISSLHAAQIDWRVPFRSRSMVGRPKAHRRRAFQPRLATTNPKIQPCTPNQWNSVYSSA